MLKKVVVGALLTGLVAVLIWGAINRTNALAGRGDGGTGHRGWSTEINAPEDNGLGGGRWSQEAQQAGGWGGGRWGQAAGNQSGSATGGLPQADSRPQTWVTLQGQVISAADDLIEIETTTGVVIPFEGQPLRFALQQQFTARVGDAVVVKGFEEDGEFKIGQITNLTNGATVTLRDVTGRPGWAGRGRRW